MSGLGDEVVTRCSSCGYALTARRYAVPHECPICRAALDPEPETSHEAAETDGPEAEPETPSPATPSSTTLEPASPSHAMIEPVTPSHAAPEPATLGPAALEPAPSSSVAYAAASSATHATPSPEPPVTKWSAFSPPSSASASSSDSAPSSSHDSPSDGSPSPGEVTSASRPASVTSPLGNVTMPMWESDAYGPAADAGGESRARETVAYTPLDAGELWSDLSGALRPADAPQTVTSSTSSASPANSAESDARPARAGAETRGMPSFTQRPQPEPPSQPAQDSRPPSQPSSFTHSSTLGLTGAPDVAAPRQGHAQEDDGAQPPPPQSSPAQSSPAPRSAFEVGVAAKLMSRYTDAYRVARATVALGTVIKVVGVLLGLLIGFGMFAVAAAVGGPGPRGGGAGLVLGLFFGGATFAFFFVLGVILSSFGQLKKAALDGAVNSSPFLTNEQRADVMSLR